MHSATADLLTYFAYNHLPERLQKISKPFCDLAAAMARDLPETAETTMCLRKLLEAKDCAVRSSLGGAYRVHTSDQDGPPNPG